MINHEYPTNKEMEKCSNNRFLTFLNLKRKHCFHNIGFSENGVYVIKRCCWCTFTASEKDIKNHFHSSKHGKYIPPIEFGYKAI